MTVLADPVRVCPGCGADAAHDDVCRTCGTNLAGLRELPTRDEWLARKRAPSGRAPSVRSLLHPTETSRLILAVTAAGLTLASFLFLAVAAHAASALPMLAGLAIFVMLLAASLWFAQQLLRARLLGQSVKVAADSLPELHALVEEVKATLHYRRRVDVYVSDKQPTPIITTSYLGTRMILLEGDFVAGLMQDPNRPQLVFLVGRAIGALRAQHQRLTFLLLLLEGLDILKFPAPFILPWYRATTYSGDQIGMVCCGDAEAALAATRRLLVGRDLAGQIHTGDVLPQVCLVRRSFLPRLIQLFLSEMPDTNRYANLLCFVRYHDPELWQRLRAAMPSREVQLLEHLWSRSPHRRRLRAGS